MFYLSGSSLYGLDWNGSSFASTTYPTGSGVVAAELDQGAVVTGVGSTLQIWDVKDWYYGIHWIGGAGMPANIRALTVAGGFAYVACADAVLRVVDIREP